MRCCKLGDRLNINNEEDLKYFIRRTENSGWIDCSSMETDGEFEFIIALAKEQLKRISE